MGDALMTRILLLLLFAVTAALAVPRPIVRPLFNVDVGGTHNVYSAERETENGYYHDLEKDEMIHDEDLLCELMSFSGLGFNVSGKAGAILFRQIAPFVELGYYRVKGEYRLKDYSRDKEENEHKGSWTRVSFGLGVQYTPYVDPKNFLDGTFVGASFGWLGVIDEFRDDKVLSDYHYGIERMFFKLEVGKLWEVYERLFVGVSIKDAIEFGMYEGSELGNSLGLYLTIQKR